MALSILYWYACYVVMKEHATLTPSGVLTTTLCLSVVMNNYCSYCFSQWTDYDTSTDERGGHWIAKCSILGDAYILMLHSLAPLKSHIYFIRWQEDTIFMYYLLFIYFLRWQEDTLFIYYYLFIYYLLFIYLFNFSGGRRILYLFIIYYLFIYLFSQVAGGYFAPSAGAPSSSLWPGFTPVSGSKPWFM